MGFISNLNELFLFEKKVAYQQNKVECWLQGAESSMQETVGKLINYAVNTFPKQSLDEWILDYPQQIILTTIHLILTHEINELFEEMRKDKENGGNHGHGDDQEDRHHDDSEEDYTGQIGITAKTPDTRDLIKNSQMTHRTISQQQQHISQKSSIRFMRKQGENNNQIAQQIIGGIAPRKVPTHDFDSKGKSSIKQSNYSSQNQQQNIKNQQQIRNQQFQQHYNDEISYNQQDYIHDENSESELEALDISRERKKFAQNMFGSDFDINLVTVQLDHNKDDTMRILQEKSFRGLYLRLQFWINQICKSLHMSKPCTLQWKNAFENNQNTIELPTLSLELHPVQRLVMQTIINFLSYMRDVVFELKQKKVDNVEDFDWQKQMRLTWNGKDSGCKVDCGAWTTQQANEYIGGQQRVPLTPLTNKYFVFISAAFREKSAVLFRTVPSHDYCGDIFKEFSSICSVPFKQFQCNPKLSMKSLMQFLNGAALASTWLFFEHIDKLDHLHLQVFNKEIQMVQQQFIIAELSQDSSVITAHITVGNNQSISQCQRSIERVRDQASLEGKKGKQEGNQYNTKQGHSSTSQQERLIISNRGQGNDIKIEDNMDDEEEDEDKDFSYFGYNNGRFGDDNIKQENIQQQFDDQLSNLNLQRQQTKQELQYLLQQQNPKKQLPVSSTGYNNLNKLGIMQNLSQIDFDNQDNDIEFNNEMHNQLEEDQCDEIKLDEDCGNNQSKMQNQQQHKVCFGVFASISHQFNLKKEKWATEVSTALQSAFRVLSLTRPEMPIITSMLLKSEGFRQYKDLSCKINEAFLKVQDMLNLNDRDDSFSITLRDLKRLSKCASSLLEQHIAVLCQKKQKRNLKAIQSKPITYNNEKKSKQQLLKDMEEEDKREFEANHTRSKSEDAIICFVLELFLLEKLNSYNRNLHIKEDKAKRSIRGIIQAIFSKDTINEVDSNFRQAIVCQSSDRLWKVLKEKNLTHLNPQELDKLQKLEQFISNCKPVCLIGKELTGKTLYIRTIVKNVLKLKPVYVNPQILGNYRDVYGVYDPISTTQQVAEQQLGAVKHSVFSILCNELQNPNSALIIDGEFDQVFNETLIPYLEYQTFREDNDEAQNGQSIAVILPNGIQQTLRKNIPILYEMRSLDKVSPRFIHAIQVINTQDNIDLKQMSQRIITKIASRLKQKFKNHHQKIQENVNYCVNEILIATLYELKKVKSFDQSDLQLVHTLQCCTRTFLAIVNEISSLGIIDQTMIKITLMTLTMTIGSMLNQNGKDALEEIFSKMKTQLGIRGSIYNYVMDYNTLDIVELKQYSIDSEFIINPMLLRASHYGKLMLKNGKDIHIKGEIGSQKSTIIRYIVKNHQQDTVSKVLKIPATCFATQKSLGSLLLQRGKQGSQTSQQGTFLLVIEDANIIEDEFTFNMMDYLILTKLNNYCVFNPSQNQLCQLSYKFSQLISSSHQLQSCKSNRIVIDNESIEYDEFVRSYIHRKVQIAPSYQNQLSNVIYGTYTFLKQNSQMFDVSSSIKLSNLHILAQLIHKINCSQLKDQNLIATLFVEIQRTLTDRIIYPNLKVQVYDHTNKLIQDQMPSYSTQYSINQIDSLIFLQNGEKHITSLEEAEGYLGKYSKPVLKQLCSLNLSIKQANSNYLYICKTGSDIVRGIEEVANQMKFAIVRPEIQKYRDCQSFIQQINNSLVMSVKSSKRQVILIQDCYLNDTSYFDYMMHLITSIKEATELHSLSHFNSFIAFLQTDLRQQLIEVCKELFNQQISHSPHSGISSPASPSSLQLSITDSQHLMNALSKISLNVKFIVILQNLPNYQILTKRYQNYEHLFQTAFIPEENPSMVNILEETQQWVHGYSLKQVFTEEYVNEVENLQDLFKNEYNSFYIPKYKQKNILQNAFFDSSNLLKVNSELNLTIPSEFTLCKERYRLFCQLVNTIKQVLYKSLASQKQYYQQYYEKYEQLQADFMKKILTKDQSAVSKNHVIVFNLISIQDKIELLQQQLKLKDSASKLKEKERCDTLQRLDKLQDNHDLYIQKTSVLGKVTQHIARLKTIQAYEFKNLAQPSLNTGTLKESDQQVIEALQALLQSKKSFNSHLSSQQDFLQQLESVINKPISETLIQKYQKPITKRLQQNEQDTSLISLLSQILNQLFQKAQIDKKNLEQEENIKILQEQISFILTTQKLYQQQMLNMKEEVEDLSIKEKNLKTEMRDVIRRVDMKDIQTLRNDHTLKSFLKQGKKSESKLDKVKIRLKNLEGDSIILASSIAYLGAFSVQERMEFRKQLAEKLLASRNIESSEYWLNTTCEQIHCKYFKKIIQNDFGLQSSIFNKLNHLFVDSLFSEFLFAYLLSPTVPIIYDSVGNYQQELTEQILDELNSFKVKVAFSSDYMIEEKIQNVLQHGPGHQQSQLLYINDLQDYSKQISGKSQDQSILHRLAEQEYFRKIQNTLKVNSALSLPQLTLFSASSHFNLNDSYLAKATVINATYVNKNEAWIEIKQILLKHFLPDNYQKLTMIKEQTQKLRWKLQEKQKLFEQLFMKVKRQWVEDRDHKSLESIRMCYTDIKQIEEDYQQYNQAFHNLINEHPLLASYSNIFVILYYALKELSKFTEEITYSWKIYTKVIDMVIAKIIRDLTMNLKNKENEESDDEQDGQQHANDMDGDVDLGGRKKKKKDKEFTIDEEFFHSVIMPSIYSTIVAGIKQEHVSLFNLIFSMEIALKKTTVTQEDKNFFIAHFFQIENCYDWRLSPHKPSTIPSGFIDSIQAPYKRIKMQEYTGIKRDILKIYPDLRKLFETIEIKIGKEFTYKEANNLLYQKLFKQGGNNDGGSNSTWKDLPLIKKLNVGFLCPDDEWRSKTTQFVYEELTTIFDFTEDLNKLHNFIKTASWSLPIALFTSNSINIVNTVCSIASYYGVGLEVLRTDYQQSIKKHENYYINKSVNDNLKSSHMDMDPDKPLSNEAACVHYDQIDSSKEDRVLMQKYNNQRMFAKDELEIDDKQITQNQSSIQLIEKCAENGTWVLISTLKFPSFWYKISRKLEKMAKKGKVLNTFRLFFDLQGYSLQEIPESFLFNHSVKFYLTEKNNEDMEGFNDVWANILNDDLLNAKDLHNVPVLEPPSDMVKINLNLESNMYESSMDSLVPQMNGNYNNDRMNPTKRNQIGNKKTVKEDKITYSMSSQYQSKDTIQLPQIFTKEHIRDIMQGGNDLRSPREINHHAPRRIKNRMHQQNLDDEISEISIHNHFIQSGLVSGSQSILLMDDMSQMEGAFFSELNQAFARKMTSLQRDEQQEEQKQQPKYEMVKKPAPNHKRQQPPQKY